jgi:hypothetical protein
VLRLCTTTRSESFPPWQIALQLILVALPLFAAPAYFDLRRAIRLLKT